MRFTLQQLGTINAVKVHFVFSADQAASSAGSPSPAGPFGAGVVGRCRLTP